MKLGNIVRLPLAAAILLASAPLYADICNSGVITKMVYHGYADQGMTPSILVQTSDKVTTLIGLSGTDPVSISVLSDMRSTLMAAFLSGTVVWVYTANPGDACAASMNQSQVGVQLTYELPNLKPASKGATSKDGGEP